MPLQLAGIPGTDTDALYPWETLSELCSAIVFNDTQMGMASLL